MDRDELIKVTQAFFFRGMLHGWPSGRGKTDVPDMPGYKKHEHVEGDFHIRDQYTRDEESGKSEGSTRIWYRRRVVWSMHYSGRYEKRAIPLLKSALRRAYEHGHFNGGRGPKLFGSSGLIYSNIEIWWKFDKFSGHESIIDNEQNTILGSHAYNGQLLI